jgi:hypothetical protein
VVLTAEERQGIANGTYKWVIYHPETPDIPTNLDALNALASRAEGPADAPSKRQTPAPVSTSTAKIGVRATFDCPVFQSIFEKFVAQVQTPITRNRDTSWIAAWSLIRDIQSFRPRADILLDRSKAVQSNTAVHNYCAKIEILNLQCAYYMEEQMSIQYSPGNLTIEATGTTVPTMKEICIRGMECPRGVYRGCSVKSWGPET